MMRIIILLYFLILDADTSCAPGSFYNVTRTECQYCPLSQYQNQSGQTSCIPCPNGTITRQKGAISADVCKGTLSY